MSQQSKNGRVNFSKVGVFYGVYEVGVIAAKFPLKICVKRLGYERWRGGVLACWHDGVVACWRVDVLV